MLARLLSIILIIFFTVNFYFSMMSNIFVGTSGFSYPSWKDDFYPHGLTSSKWFSHYCTQFNTLELNSTFYKFPVIKTLKNYYDKSPDHFIFSVKVHKIITHTRRLKNAKEKIDEFTDIVRSGLKDKAGCLLFQFPPTFIYTAENVELILETIPHSPENIVEFRHPSWWNKFFFEELKKNKITFCTISHPVLPNDIVSSTDLFYLRMHGVPVLFQSSYSAATLEEYARAVKMRSGNSFIYFNNTVFDAGYRNAFTLKKQIV
jgi:uncharacterized protein YecE (DUF72 family)